MTYTKYPAPAFKGLLSDFFFNPTFVPATAHKPQANIAKTSTGFRVELALPGFGKEDLSVKIDNQHLVIGAQKTTDTTQTEQEVYQHREFSAQSFERSFRLPDTIDAEQVSATFENGLLVIHLNNKPEHQPASKVVEIS
jgi:HSP20 family protein